MSVYISMEFKKRNVKILFFWNENKNSMNNISANLVNTEKKEVKVAVF